MTPQSISKLQRLRDILGKPIKINSACRCPLHNARVGGVTNSTHRSTQYHPACAFDISLHGHDKATVITAAEQAGFKAIGINYNTFVHVDDRSRFTRW